MREKLRVGISEYRVARSPTVLVTHGLGSCLGIALYDPDEKIGGLAHTLLPAPRLARSADPPTRFVETAVRMMLEELVGGGASRERLLAKLVGGANMFPGQRTSAEKSIGSRNVRAARTILEELEIPLVGEDVGGRHGRGVDFDLASGQLLVHSAGERGRLTIF